MKKLSSYLLLVSLFATAPVYANENYDLKCTLDNGDQMTVSHNSSTVYIEFLGAKGDPDEGGSVIKLDIPSGSAQQTITSNPNVGTASFTLRGTDEDIDGAVSVVYEEYDGVPNAYFSTMNTMGNETSNLSCEPGTVKASVNLTKQGIAGINKAQAPSQPVAEPEPQAIPKTSPVKISIGQRVSQYSTMKTVYRTVNIISVTDNLVINRVIVNRDQCSGSVGNPSKAFKLPYGRTVSYSFTINSQRCDVVEVIVKTNQGDWTLNP